MNIHEFGMENEKVVMLIHPSAVMWDYFEYVIPLMDYPEAEGVMTGETYGFNIKSQLLKLLVIFPAVFALAAWICTLF